MLALRRALLLGGLLAAASLSTGAYAGPINGSQTLNYDSLTIHPTNANLAGVTSFDVTLRTATGASQRTGDYVALGAAQNLNPTTFTIATPGSFTFGSATFGTFTGSSGMELASATPLTTRTFYVIGTFVPGSGFAGTITQNTASVVINLIQNGTDGSFGGSIVLNTPSIPPPGVPEPASLAMAAVPALLGLITLRKRAAK